MKVVRKGTRGPVGETDNLTQFYTKVYWGSGDGNTYIEDVKTSELEKFDEPVISHEQQMERELDRGWNG